MDGQIVHRDRELRRRRPPGEAWRSAQPSRASAKQQRSDVRRAGMARSLRIDGAGDEVAALVNRAKRMRGERKVEPRLAHSARGTLAACGLPMATKADGARDAPTCVLYHGPGIASDDFDSPSLPADQLLAAGADVTSASVLLVDAKFVDRIGEARAVPDHVVIVATDDAAKAELGRRADALARGNHGRGGQTRDRPRRMSDGRRTIRGLAIRRRVPGAEPDRHRPHARARSQGVAPPDRRPEQAAHA